MYNYSLLSNLYPDRDNEVSVRHHIYHIFYSFEIGKMLSVYSGLPHIINRQEKNMKKSPVYLLFSLAVIWTIFFSNINSAEAVSTGKWYTKPSSFEKIVQAAKKKNKPYILFFYTDWCGYCKKMHKKYLSNAKINKVLSGYYTIKINPDDGEEEKALAQKKGVNGYPDFRVVHPDGRSIPIHPFRKGKSLKVKAFIKYLKAALKG
ncbi:MAG: hypothetical protein D3904_16745 [Candidatus Electrothrix sp. EH2]|nr:hypothetical protein [Candidatus Electrothrix sp. EH2]